LENGGKKMPCFDYPVVYCVRCKQGTQDGYQIIDDQVICEVCWKENPTMKCKFCNSFMSLEGQREYCCDFCEATFEVAEDGKGEWTLPVKNLRCNICDSNISMDELHSHDERGAVCNQCALIDGAVPRFKLGANIWYMKNDRACEAEVWTKCTVANSREKWASTEAQKRTWQHFGPSGIFYVTCHGIIEEDKAFGSKEELLESL
jgi:hypothetical protein